MQNFVTVMNRSWRGLKGRSLPDSLPEGSAEEMPKIADDILQSLGDLGIEIKDVVVWVMDNMSLAVPVEVHAFEAPHFQSKHSDLLVLLHDMKLYTQELTVISRRCRREIRASSAFHNAEFHSRPLEISDGLRMKVWHGTSVTPYVRTFQWAFFAESVDQVEGIHKNMPSKVLSNQSNPPHQHQPHCLIGCEVLQDDYTSKP
ncbi:unnamed protein product [Phytophthora lilii]|uniref:Unnamed protein product n=1 Tax=Phytophthora lilii TaxID=2077276 RepID=A0A9W6YJR4_9STRA|nr:unnamed protein product [Phytophthora lilii]